MTTILVHGYMGKMGMVICRLAEADDNINIACGVDPGSGHGTADFPVFKSLNEVSVDYDVIVDFSTASAVPGLIAFARKHRKPVVICTTGLTDEMIETAKEASGEIPVFLSFNMSLGINLLAALVKKCAPVLADAGFDIEILEKHHNQKIDAPSGTAILLADAIKESLDDDYTYVCDRSQTREKRGEKEIGLSSIRGGTFAGIHNIIFAGPDEVIELNHTAQSKEIFGNGAINAAKFLAHKEPGLYDMQDLLEDYI